MANHPATPEELLHSQILTVEALIRVLDRKGLVRKDEIVTEVQNVRRELEEKRKQN